MPYGFEDTDTGYIFGSSWNIYNGQFPHRDFIYTRPAIPAFFHTIFLFISETYGYILDRAFFYVQIFVYSLLGAKLLFEKFNIVSKPTLYFIAMLGAIISIHNYPPMAWNTVDGVFFSMIGVFLLVRTKANLCQLFLGSFCVMLGMFSKQSFYFIPLFIFVYFVLVKDWKRLVYYAIFGVLSGLLYLVFKYSTGSLDPFLEQTFQRTSSSALVDAGIKAYYLALKFNIFYLTGIMAAIWISIKFIHRKYAYVLVNLMLALFILAFYFENSDKWSAITNVIQLVFIVAVVLAIYRFKRDRSYLLLLLLLTLSWSASISNGYRTPIHFSLPLVFAVYIMFFRPNEKQISKMLSVLVLGFYLVVFYIGYQTIYRDANRNELTYSMEEVFPQLKFIKSDKETFEKYSELKQLAKQYPNFAVIPSATHAHYLTQTVNPIGTDWPLDVEINNDAENLAQQLSAKKAFVFVERKNYTIDEIEGYSIIGIIKNTWTLNEEGNYFDVYVSK